ncbi:MAG: hypothetical protein H9533_04875 [Rhodobacteraceae bacterium]|nr:hypothetical protein [Paracoccaceae bacterium]
MTRLDEKERYFRDFSVWPTHAKLNIRGWLTNFLPEELPTAQKLISSLVFFNEQMTDALFRGALQNYLASLHGDVKFSQPPSTINLDEVAFVLCEGEVPHPTDSAHLFARKLRDSFNVPSHSIYRPADALNQLSWKKHYIFFDDFAGSGNQFIDTIERNHPDAPQFQSYAELINQNTHTIAYCPCICTKTAEVNIARKYPGIKLSPSHILGPESNSTLPQSRVWSGVARAEADDGILHIQNSSFRAGYTATDGSQDGWRGFHELGLLLAFAHGIPDASLPILYSTRNNWTPLIGRAQ